MKKVKLCRKFYWLAITFIAVNVFFIYHFKMPWQADLSMLAFMLGTLWNCIYTFRVIEKSEELDQKPLNLLDIQSTIEQLDEANNQNHD